MQQQFEDSKIVSQIFNLPGFIITYVVVDWMHTVDLGIAQYLLGNLLLELLKRMGGTRSNPQPALSEMLLLIKQMSRQY